MTTHPIPLEARRPEGAVGATQPFNAREALRAERESFTLDDVMAYIRDETPVYSSAFVGVGNAIGAIGTFKTRRFKPSWSAEVDPTQQQMWTALTRTLCLENFFDLDPEMLPWVFLMVLTLPCTDFSTAGKQRGTQVR